MFTFTVQKPTEWSSVVEMQMAFEVLAAWSLQSGASLCDAVKAGVVLGRVQGSVCSGNAFGASRPEGLPKRRKGSAIGDLCLDTTFILPCLWSVVVLVSFMKVSLKLKCCVDRGRGNVADYHPLREAY